MKRVLVTGGSGLLGKYVVEALKDTFHVTVFDKAKPAYECAFVEGDILGRTSIDKALVDQDCIVHLAALDAAIKASDDDFIRVNVEGTWNLFSCARNAGIKRVVQCSSVSAVNISPENPPQYLPVDLDHHADPQTAYGLSKLMGEKIARRFFTLGGMDVICLRPSLIMAPEYVYDVALTSSEADGTTLPPPASHDTWKSWGRTIPGARDYVDSRDAGAAFLAALNADHIPWGIFYVTSADSYSALPTTDVVQREYSVSPEIRDPDLYAGDSRASIYDISTTTEELGWTPAHGWPEILQDLLSSVQIAD
ncbi:MAG: NAD(P)-dependent oxidoreductase [Rhodospirillales bacterium]|jgi:UDP-glucose 4-epimerase|nr:NAD(P)-dependent oxidoreductase [Rhodospirillales bacterium]MBT4038452.1 NAD(P)-dependent oxidoreductase [Rhodospirillales bacterium]MBT4627374.1 NAD(P)-dependent oxidoreductase [Rhodospirillales bacterium]MBT5350916.1 NAD(P)-dependent oxidoreductase [Rhodospirillales bacterium]MBT5519593.1 NAD(P)-dependent oxidoreductase [Rhodospirillales bacterium]